MLDSLRFRTRILLLVATATIALLSITAVTQLMGRRSEREVNGVETRYLPLIELERDLKAGFAPIPRALEKAADAAEDSGLQDADGLVQQLADRIATGAPTLATNGGDARALDAELHAYYTAAREVTAALIHGTPADTLVGRIGDMRRAQAAFEAHLDAATTPDRARMAAAFASARDAQDGALYVEIGAATATLLLMVLLSWQIIRRTVRTLGDVSDGMERFANGDFDRRIDVTTRDELGALARQANEMAVKLGEYRTEKKRQAEELRLAADELRQTNSELDRASRYKSEFLANMSHELRTPLNSIMILSKILAGNETGNLTAKQTEFATMIHRSGEELLALINDVLDMAKIEAGKQDLELGRLRVVDMFEYVRRMFEPQALQRGLTFEVAVADDVPVDITTDRARLAQILKNLVANAFKFTERGGTVRVAVARHDDTALAITVTDTGIGIPKDKQALIFEAFAQAEGGTSRKYGGTGLGLTIARQLAVRLGGELSVESDVGKGSRFRVLLPIEHAEATVAVPRTISTRTATPAPGVRAQLPTIADDRASVERGKPCVLVIEDDPEFAKTVRDLVREAGFKCLVASEGRPGLELARELVPSGIVLDVGLPDLDGWAVMELLKAERATRDIPVHFVTATATDGAARAARLGAVGFMAKPVEAMQLRSALRALEEAGRAGVRKVLLVEHEASVRTSMQTLLAGSDFVVEPVATPEEAAARIAEATFGCIVMNLALPDAADGLALVAKIRAVPRTAHVPIVVHTRTSPTVGELRTLETDPRVIVVIDGERSPERVLEETRGFVQRVRTALPSRGTTDQIPRLREAALEGKTVLVVDDDMRNVYSLSSALRAKKLVVLTAADGQEALDELAQHPETHLVLMDITMPRMDGHEATRRIRAQPQLAKLPIIALTANTLAGEREKCIAAGASDYVPKPVDVDRLVTLLCEWLAEPAVPAEAVTPGA